jgi:hypothetical protein
VLRRIFGPRRDGVTGGWRKLHSEELHNLYSSPSVIRIIKSRKMRWVGHVARMGEKRNVYRLLVGKPAGMRPLGRARSRWIGNIKMDLLEIGLNVGDWIGLAQDRYRWRALVTKPQGLVGHDGLGNLVTFSYLIGSGTRDLPACSIVPQPLRFTCP